MGLIVPEAVLPNGITVSNVYMCIPSTIYYFPRSGDGSYQIGSQYKVYKDSTKMPKSDITFPISITVQSVSNISPHELLYEELKKTYNGYTESIENVSVPLYPPPFTPNDETSGGTLPIVYDDSTPQVIYDDDAPVA